jgi:hypothetical protein
LKSAFWTSRPPESVDKFVGEISGLSPDQIRDTFRAADYTPQQVDAFSQVVEQRINELNNL